MTYKELQQKETVLFISFKRLSDNLKKEYRKDNIYTSNDKDFFRELNQDIKQISCIPGFHNKIKALRVMRRYITQHCFIIGFTNHRLSFNKVISELIELYKNNP